MFQNDLETILNRSEHFDIAMRCSNGTHSTLLKLYLGDHIMAETMVLLNRVTGFVERYDTILNDSIWARVSTLLKRYDPFVIMDTDKIKTIVQSNL